MPLPTLLICIAVHQPDLAQGSRNNMVQPALNNKNLWVAASDGDIDRVKVCLLTAPSPPAGQIS
jgi:hypothetical protein